KDAMSGLDLAKRIVNDGEKVLLETELKAKRAERARDAQKPKVIAEAEARRSTHVEIVKEPPKAPDFDQHILTNTPLEHVWSFINPLMLYGRHLGLKGQMLRKLGTPRQKELEKTEAGR